MPWTLGEEQKLAVPRKKPANLKGCINNMPQTLTEVSGSELMNLEVSFGLRRHRPGTSRVAKPKTFQAAEASQSAGSPDCQGSSVFQSIVFRLQSLLLGMPVPRSRPHFVAVQSFLGLGPEASEPRPGCRECCQQQ